MYQIYIIIYTFLDDNYWFLEKKKKIKIEWEKVVPSNGNWEKELMTVN